MAGDMAWQGPLNDTLLCYARFVAKTSPCEPMFSQCREFLLPPRQVH
jgi:hypothetical protein